MPEDNDGSILVHAGVCERGYPCYATPDGRFKTTLDKQVEMPTTWVVENKTGLNHRFPSLRGAEDWVRARLGQDKATLALVTKAARRVLKKKKRKSK